MYSYKCDRSPQTIHKREEWTEGGGDHVGNGCFPENARRTSISKPIIISHIYLLNICFHTIFNPSRISLRTCNGTCPESSHGAKYIIIYADRQ